ncbi:YflJ family protein [Desertibacillus haloalkaliphilus]|nr:YflJ family protein [Desertibacillus haloalkaliphilus]MBU8907988.1 YflJ family protein [Desertibacillus haloalkaliphilus]
MAHIGSKGWYVERLKEEGIRYHQGKKLERYKTHVLANLYAKQTSGENRN